MANEPSGSIFTITLPMDIKATTSIPSEIKITENESISENESLTRSHSDEKVNILIVEDNEDFRSFIINCLKDFYEVFDASNGVEALSVLENNDIKMVISDVMMPVMDGMELCQKIKNNIKYSHIPVILLTARTADEHILNGLQEGADDYITKPFNLKILLLRIRKLLEWSLNVHNKFKTIDLSPSEITVSNLDEKLIEKAMQALEENMDNSEFSVEDLSACVNMSRGHLYKKLMSITGKSPIEFIRIMRIKRGRQLLEQSQLNISQISYQVGLSPKQFSKYFKEEYGYLPSAYKFRKTEDIFN